MANIMDEFPTKYLSASDVEDHPTVTIGRIGREEVGKDKEWRPIVYFHEFEKGVVLNKTNATNIARMYGSDTDNWGGKTVVLGTEIVSYNGESKPAIRVWPPKRQAAKATVNTPLKQRQPDPDGGGGQPFAPLPEDAEIPF